LDRGKVWSKWQRSLLWTWHPVQCNSRALSWAKLFGSTSTTMHYCAVWELTHSILQLNNNNFFSWQFFYLSMGGVWLCTFNKCSRSTWITYIGTQRYNTVIDALTEVKIQLILQWGRCVAAFSFVWMRTVVKLTVKVRWNLAVVAVP
jgi:hypothetical protein